MTDVKEIKKLLKSKNTVDKTPNRSLCCLNFPTSFQSQVRAHTHTHKHDEVIPNVAFYHIYQTFVTTTGLNSFGFVRFFLLFSACDSNQLTSRLWRAAAEQLEVEVVGAKALALQMFQ